MKRLTLISLLAAVPVWADAERVALPNGALELAGSLYMPAGKGPFPAAAMLHGCNGMWSSDGEPTQHYASWAKHFQERGFKALLLDSFGVALDKSHLRATEFIEAHR